MGSEYTPEKHIVREFIVQSSKSATETLEKGVKHDHQS